MAHGVGQLLVIVLEVPKLKTPRLRMPGDFFVNFRENIQGCLVDIDGDLPSISGEMII